LGQVEDDGENNGMNTGDDQGFALGWELQQHIGTEKEKEQGSVDRNNPVHYV
jgi:hypothetical protein